MTFVFRTFSYLCRPFVVKQPVTCTRNLFGYAFRKMPPVPGDNKLKDVINKYIEENKVMVFSKTTCPFCAKVKDLFRNIGAEYTALELNTLENGAELQAALAEVSGQRTVPNVYINGSHIGGYDDTMKRHSENQLLPLLQKAGDEPHNFDYDLIVIGGGSGGLAAAKEAGALGFKVACLDFVKPSPQGTSWDLGGTCVNVGCIPKKLMHQAAILGHSLEDAKAFGWQVGEAVPHNWQTMKNAIQDHIHSLNWGYRVALREKSVSYINAYGEFIGDHKIKTTNKKGKTTEITSKYFIIATGGRPKYPDLPGCKEYCISSDDLFSLPYAPGKTLVIGASYVSLECAGFLGALGYDTTVMVRSILLRGFDQQCAEAIGQYMADHGVKFLRPCVPTNIEQVRAPTESKAGLHRVTYRHENGKEATVECNTVMMAVGRDPCTSGIGLDVAGVNLNPKTGFVVANDEEQTSCPYVYAVGDILDGKPELTPVAIQAGRLLAKRLFAGATLKTDYVNVPTTVFTPLEYGAIGLSEETAIEQYGKDDIEVYHSNYWPVEWTVAHREENACYAKLICVKSLNEKVVGLHVLGPNAGEITQGFTLGLKLGATKADFDNAIGIHPTCAEIFTTLSITKRSGESAAATGC